MDGESLNQYVGKRVKIILNNNFWYKAEVISSSENEFKFVDIKGKNISVDPSFVSMVEEIE